MVMGLLGIGIISGFFQIGDVLTGFYTLVFALVLVSIFGIVGAIFLGMFISHRVLSTQEFTAFEEEMLKMKDDVEYIRKKLEEQEKN